MDNDRAIGVRLANDCELRAEVVVSAADGHSTIFESAWLDAIMDQKITERYRKLETALPHRHDQLWRGAGISRRTAAEFSCC